MTSTIAVPTAVQLYKAITSNSPDVVELYLQRGVDPNIQFGDSAIPVWDEIISDDDDAEERETIVKALKDRIIIRQESYFTYPLHLAVINAYHHHKADTRSNALDIITLLLKHGADTENLSSKLTLPNIEGYLHHTVSTGSLIDLAIFLKRFPFEIYERETSQTLDSVIKLIVNADKRKKDVSAKKEMAVETSNILTATVNTYKKLLFSPSFSDVKFLCSDDVTLHAHKNILATSSNYFKTAFEGSWAETNGDGVWKTVHTSKLMIPILTLIYTGDVEQSKQLCSASDFDPLELFEVAAEYDLQPIIPLAVDNCIQLIKSGGNSGTENDGNGNRNIRSILRAANLHENDKLRNACFRYIKENPVMLMDPDIITLGEEEKELWKALGEYISSGTKNCKRKRSK